MKRGSKLKKTARENGVPKQQGITARSDAGIEHDRDGGADTGTQLREAVRETEPPVAFDARAVRDLYKAAPTDPTGLRRTIRRSQLRQIVPLADSTIYELERRGEFPQRFFLTPRCVVWDLAEVLAWVQSRRQLGNNGVKKAPIPDYRQRGSRRDK